MNITNTFKCVNILLGYAFSFREKDTFSFREKKTDKLTDFGVLGQSASA